MPSTNTWLAKFGQLRANPQDVQSLAMAQLDAVYGGSIDISDPTSPFVFLMACSAVNAAGCIVDYGVNTRLHYSRMAQTREDLYVHMSDVDYIDMFASPSRATIRFFFELSELQSRLVDTGVNGIKKLIIPKFTQVTVNNDLIFTMQYAIEIRQMAHQGLSIIYLQDEISPVQVLETNIVPWQMSVSSVDGVVTTFVEIPIPMYQFEISSTMLNAGYSTGLKKVIPYTDQFYYARAYQISATGVETEILTTHSALNFDPTKPTLILKDLGGELQVNLPQIYLTNRAVSLDIRLDVYTTRGEISQFLGDYVAQLFITDYNGASADQTPYVAPLANFATRMVYSDDTTLGGQNQLDFASLRDRVMANNFGQINLPITPTQLSYKLQDLGYDPVINIDNVTNRQVLATRLLPTPTPATPGATPLTSTGAAMGIETFVASIMDLAPFSAVKVNGERATLLSNSLFLFDKGKLSLVSDAQLAAFQAMDPDALVRAINSASYMYTPFHYVMDTTDNTFNLRPYYLDSPTSNRVQFIQANESAGIAVGTGQRTIVRNDKGYELQIRASSSASWKTLTDDQVFCQLAFIPEGEKVYAYLNGTLVGTDPITNERIYSFALETNYDVDHQDSPINLDNLILTSFQMFNDEERKHGAPLTHDYDVFWAATGLSGDIDQTQIDLDMGKQILPDGVVGLARERMNITLGQSLDQLWHSSRSIAGSGTYQTYSADVPATYTANVYEIDPATGVMKFVRNPDGTLSPVLLHSVGDPILDGQGNPTYLHHKDEQVLDGNGKPIPVQAGSIQHLMDLLMIEGVYWFASESEAVAYRSQIAQLLTQWITQDIEPMQAKVLEKTQLFFYPKSTTGNVDVRARDNTKLSIAAQQTMSVTYELDTPNYNDPTLRKPLTDTAVSTIAAAFRNKTVSIKSILATLQALVGETAVGLVVTGMGGDQNLSTVTVLDDSQRLTIRKLAVLEADGTLGVIDGVGVDFTEQDTTATS